MTAKTIARAHKYTFIQPLDLKVGQERQAEIYFSDLETVVFPGKTAQTPVAMSLLDTKNNYKAVLVKAKTEALAKEEFSILLDSLLPRKQKAVIYIHNLGRFDGYLLITPLAKLYGPKNLAFIERNRRIYQITVKIDSKTTLEFRDSLNIIPLPIKDFAKAGLATQTKPEGAETLYKDFHTAWTHNPEAVTHLLRQDTEILKTGMEIVRDTLKAREAFDIYPKTLTLPSAAFSIYRQNHFHLITKNTLAEDDFIRQAYIGGTTELFKPYLRGGFYYDVNSLYPHIMATAILPAIKGVKIKNPKDIDINKTFGFIRAKVEAPSTLLHPCLPCKHPQYGIIYPTGKWEATFFSEELKYAASKGYKIKPIEALSFLRDDTLFKDYIQNLYTLRLESPKGSALNTIAKLLLNSLYGRFGMKIQREQAKLTSKTDVEALKEDHTITRLAETEIEGLYNVSFKKITPEDPAFNPNNINPREGLDLNIAVQISAAIAAQARIHMKKTMEDIRALGIEVYYTDTDSIVTDRPLPLHMVSQTALGKLKLEHVLKEAVFLDNKFYALITDKDQYIFVTKGIQTKDLNPKISDTALFAKFKEALTQNPTFTTQRQNPFKIDYIRLAINQVLEAKHLKPLYNKKTKTFTGHTWTATKPIHLDTPTPNPLTTFLNRFKPF